MKVLLLSRYCRKGASSRVRSYQYIPFLRRNGIEVDIWPLFDDHYLKKLYQGKKTSIYDILTSYIQRLGRLLKGNRYSLVWIEKEIFPWLPAFGELGLKLSRVPYIVDYDDALFHRYDCHKYALVRFFLGRKIDAVMKHAALVIVGNDYLGARARQAGAKRVERLPTVVDLGRYKLKSNRRAEGKAVIGWIGTQITSKYLNRISGALSELARHRNVEFVAVGPKIIPDANVQWITVPWSESNEVEKLQTFDIGIMPLDDSPWERGKCGYKLIQYMACGLPVVASPVGVNKEIVVSEKNGFLAASTEEWRKAFYWLIDNPVAAYNMGKTGRQRIEAEYCLEVTGPKLSELLRSVDNR